MTISPLREIIVLSSSLLAGVIIGVIYDILRRIKRFFGFSSLLVDIGDVVIFLSLSLCAYYSVYIINDAKVRWYEIFGIFSGFFMYMSALSHYVVRFLMIFERALIGIINFIKKILTPMFRLFVQGITGAKRRILRLKIWILSKKRKKIMKFDKIKHIFRKI